MRQPAAQLESLQRSAGGGELPVTIIGAGGGRCQVMLFSGINVDARTGDDPAHPGRQPARQLLPGMYVRAKVPRVRRPAH